MAEHIETGKTGEELAVRYLQTQHFRILGRNISNPSGKRLGEIDIVAQKGEEIVFVEVKTMWKCKEEWLPEWNVTDSKLRKLDRIAEYFLKKEELGDIPYRFDVVAIVLEAEKEPEIRHIPYVFL